MYKVPEFVLPAFQNTNKQGKTGNLIFPCFMGEKMGKGLTPNPEPWVSLSRLYWDMFVSISLLMSFSLSLKEKSVLLYLCM